ncbi:1-(5-phosphoribosyl)-5-[(5-phosphoribosylamino) methylideneamino] imidazole-4-carboxamide isomerase [Campylobacterota bacterium]|nr:1-(5-phosphoribosyl)-5-[(5-phosphoribosylamino) methylideneamino] imidazole-4-carboxamide isomerase [Campylobacterota bacterium]
MLIIPAIDLKDNRAVRLTKGEMASAKIYGDPAAFAKDYEAAGAEWLHIVDLDGAFAAEPKNHETIEKIARETKLKIELGGGIRSEETIARYLEMGVSRVILGSLAAKNPKKAIEIAQKYPIAIGIDAKNGFVATAGWAETEKLEAAEFVALFKGSKVQAVICTDISRDGMLSGVNGEWTLKIKQAFGGFTIASGGVTKKAEFDDLGLLGIDGAVVGKAIYEGKISIKELFN